MDEKPFIVKHGSKIKLSNYETNGKDMLADKENCIKEFKKCRKEIDRLQDILYAEHKHHLLIVLQAMDTAGKDGTIHAVFKGVNPQGVKVASFKAPTTNELDHDYLWRIHEKTPGKGEIVIFNRSHYEDVLIARVHNLVPEKVWKLRYRHINEFERMLVEEGTTIIKIFLHIDPATQKERLVERIDIPEKQWKFSPNDIEERKLWPAYMAAYEAAINETSSKWAPWYIVPSDHNWVRDRVVAGIIYNALQRMDLKYPIPVENITQYRDKII